jgi:hypothetical protein
MRSSPVLTGRSCRLVPVATEHHDYLRHMEATNLGVWWRGRGVSSSPEEFARRIWHGTTVQFLAIGEPDGVPLLWLQCYSLDTSTLTANVSVARLEERILTPRAASGFVLFVDYCFEQFGLRKIYLEVAEPNLDLFGNAVGPLFYEEARLREQIPGPSGFRDLIILALWRDVWTKSPLRQHFAEM